MDITGAILAGGQGRRMGGAIKPLVQITNREGEQQTIYHRQRSVLSSLCQRVIVSAAAPAPWAIDQVVIDAFANAGPLAGIHRVLMASQQWALIVAGDMPFLRIDVLQLLIDAARDSVVPLHAVAFEIAGRPQPLCALFHCSAADLIEAQLIDQQYKVGGLLASSHLTTYFIPEREVAAIDPALRHFHNVNSAVDVNDLSSKF
jgi:molybdenum cofactor guanylyltransferase